MKTIKTGKVVELTLLNIFYITLCVVVLVPILYALLISFSGGGTLLTSNIGAMFSRFTLDNYIAVFTEANFVSWFQNTVILCCGTMVLSMSVAIVAAYAFSRYRFAGRKGILKLLLI